MFVHATRLGTNDIVKMATFSDPCALPSHVELLYGHFVRRDMDLPPAFS